MRFDLKSDKALRLTFIDFRLQSITVPGCYVLATKAHISFHRFREIDRIPSPSIYFYIEDVHFVTDMVDICLDPIYLQVEMVDCIVTSFVATPNKSTNWG